jgi:hypothetical protein
MRTNNKELQDLLVARENYSALYGNCAAILTEINNMGDTITDALGSKFSNKEVRTEAKAISRRFENFRECSRSNLEQ